MYMLLTTNLSMLYKQVLFWNFHFQFIFMYVFDSEVQKQNFCRETSLCMRHTYSSGEYTQDIDFFQLNLYVC